jgi:hypothetical protein
MRRHTENAKLQEWACNALWQIAFNDEENKARIGAQVENIHDYT